MAVEKLTNFVNGTFTKSNASDYLPVKNPATAQTLTEVPLSPAQAQVDAAAQAGLAAFKEWRRTPVGERIQPLFKLKGLLEANREDWPKRLPTSAARLTKRALPKFSAPLRTLRWRVAHPR